MNTTHDLARPGATPAVAMLNTNTNTNSSAPSALTRPGSASPVRTRVTAETNTRLAATFAAQLSHPVGQTADWASVALPYGLEEFAAHGNSVGAISISGLAIPFDLDRADTARLSAYHDHVLGWIAARLGFPYGYATQANGELITNLIPRKEEAAEQVGVGAVDGLTWHTEDAHFEHNCDLIVLLAVRGDAAAATLVSQVDASLLRSSTLDTLQEPDFTISSDDASTGFYSARHAVLRPDTSTASRFRLRYDPMFTQVPSEHHTAALHDLTGWINASYHSFTLGDGDILVIDNRTSVHARSKFTPRYDDTDRWIKRIRVHRTPVPADFISPTAATTIGV